MIKIHTFSLMALFTFTSYAAHERSAGEVYAFDIDILNNKCMLEKACQFCLKNARNIRIIVDDNALHRMVLKNGALKRGHAVFEFKSGDDLLKALRNDDIVSVLVPNARALVLDNKMPGTFGTEVMAIMKKEALLKWDSGRREVPVILNTETLSDIDKSAQDNFTRVSPKKNSEEALKELDEACNSPLPTRIKISR